MSENIGFSAMVSSGNMLDIGFADVLHHFASNPITDVPIRYIESIIDARKFNSAARTFSRSKPIVAY